MGGVRIHPCFRARCGRRGILGSPFGGLPRVVKITRAVITAAARDDRHLPLQQLVDRDRRFEEAIDVFLEELRRHGPSDALSSCLAAAYHDLGLQTLADQVRRSVRSLAGNQWMFRTGHPADHPLRIRPELLARETDALAGDIFLR